MMSCPLLLQEREERLSLADFDPSSARPPYLTSPRSLEACRVHGVNPVELAGQSQWRNDECRLFIEQRSLMQPASHSLIPSSSRGRCLLLRCNSRAGNRQQQAILYTSLIGLICLVTESDTEFEEHFFGLRQRSPVAVSPLISSAKDLTSTHPLLFFLCLLFLQRCRSTSSTGASPTMERPCREGESCRE